MSENGAPKRKRDELYSLGVALQNLEGQVLKRMREVLRARATGGEP